MSEKKQGKLKITSHKLSSQKESEEDLVVKLDRLREGTLKIYEQVGYPISFEILYRDSYILITNRKGPDLYSEVEKIMKTKTAEIFNRNDEGAGLLSKLQGNWEIFRNCNKCVNNLMLYLNNTFIKQNNITDVFSIGLKAVKDILLSDHILTNQLAGLLLKEVEKDRQYEAIDKYRMKRILEMLIEIGENLDEVYREVFERKFLAESRLFFLNEAEELIRNSSCPDYLKKVENRLRKEQERRENYLDSSTEEALLQLVDECYLLRFGRLIITMPGSGLDKMIENRDFEDIRRLYRLFNRSLASMNELLANLSLFLENKGEELSQKPGHKKDPIAFIYSFIELHSLFKELLSNCFCHNSKVEIAITKSFETILNKSGRTVLALAVALDHLFLKQSKGLTEAEIDAKVDSIMSLFPYIADKDIFENFHRNFLAKRLLSEKPPPEEYEELVARKLKEKCGGVYVKRIIGMINDSKCAGNNAEGYQHGFPFEFRVKVVTETFWPSERASTVPLPPELSGIAKSFTEFYQTIEGNSGKRIVWRLSVGSVLLVAHLGKNNKKYELEVSVLQATILLEFNSVSEQSYEQIIRTLQSSEEEVSKHLVYLLKSRVLVKNSPEKVINPGDVFSVNPEFSYKLIKINLIPSTLVKVSSLQETTKISGVIVQERNFYIDSIIVKIMKTRNTMEHRELLAEIFRFSRERFQPETKLIKARIENLLSREYLQRSPQNQFIYEYLA